MKTILKYIVLVCVIVHYFIGSVGFTVHHCCCCKTYRTGSCLVEGFCPYEAEDCLKKIEDAREDGSLKFRQYRHCGDYVYSMDLMKYLNEGKVPPPPLFLILFHESVPLPDNAFTARNDIDLDKHFYYEVLCKRRACKAALLCTFII